MLQAAPASSFSSAPVMLLPSPVLIEHAIPVTAVCGKKGLPSMAKEESRALSGFITPVVLL